MFDAIPIYYVSAFFLQVCVALSLDQGVDCIDISYLVPVITTEMSEHGYDSFFAVLPYIQCAIVNVILAQFPINCVDTLLLAAVSRVVLFYLQKCFLVQSIQQIFNLILKTHVMSITALSALL